MLPRSATGRGRDESAVVLHGLCEVRPEGAVLVHIQLARHAEGRDPDVVEDLRNLSWLVARDQSDDMIGGRQVHAGQTPVGLTGDVFDVDEVQRYRSVEVAHRT